MRRASVLMLTLNAVLGWTLAPAPATTVPAACPVVHRFGNVTGAFDDRVDADDAQWMRRDIACFMMPLAYCGPVDVDCSGQFNVAGSLKVLRHAAGLPYSQREPCPDIGEVVPDI